jgi:hypothetical protein
MAAPSITEEESSNRWTVHGKLFLVGFSSLPPVVEDVRVGVQTSSE